MAYFGVYRTETEITAHFGQQVCQGLKVEKDMGVTLNSGMGLCGVMSMRGVAMRPLWFASISEVRGITVETSCSGVLIPFLIIEPPGIL